MDKLNVPFNIRILNLTPDKFKLIKPVTSLDIFDQSKINFHEEGLYSVAIFGALGDPLRSKRFSYIDIKLKIFHPVIYRALGRLKSLYTEIMEGSSFAVWDAELNDFVKSTQADGETGFHFFLKHWEKIEYTENKSITRIEAIALIKKYQSIALLDKVVVMPAAMREVEYTNDRITEDEINDYYRRLLSISNTITENAIKTTPEVLNRSRLSLQKAFNELYDHIENMLEGKKKFIQGKWASRKVFNATRNVITAMPSLNTTLGDSDNININTVQIGLFQLLKANLPIAKFLIKSGFLSKIFTSASAPARLVNKKTLKAEEVMVSSDYYDTFMTDEGLDGLLNLFGEDGVRHDYMEVDGRYLALIYLGPDNTFKIFSDIDEVPQERNKEHVRPITFTEVLYCSVYKKISDYPNLVVRYPVTGMGSCSIGETRLQVTTKEERRLELDDGWVLGPDENMAKSFPVRGSAFVNAFSPNPWTITALGADIM